MTDVQKAFESEWDKLHYVCPQCGPDPRGAEVHAEEMHTFKGVPGASARRLTRRQAAIIGTYTGVVCGPMSDIHEYVESLSGFKGIGPMGLALMFTRIMAAAQPDFLALCATEDETKF